MSKSVLKNVKIETSKKIPLKNKNAKNINFYTGNILEDSRTVDLGISESFILDLFMNIYKNLGMVLKKCKNRNF